MRKDKNEAIKLRKKGLSYNQINKKLNIPKSTLSCWLKNIKLSERAEKKIKKRVKDTSIIALINRNVLQTKLAEEKNFKIRKQAEAEVNKLIDNKLFIAGISLYWAEGYKKGAYGSKWKCVDFTNSDPKMIKIIMRFFREICKVPEGKFRIQLIIHKNINAKKTVNFWSELTKIPVNQFIKTCNSISRASNGKRPKNNLINGTVHIRVYDVGLFYKIIGWIDGLKACLN